VRLLRDWGQEGKYNHVRLGFNYRMDAVQGAALGVKLTRLDYWNAERRRIANTYNAALADDFVKPAGPFGLDHACHVYAVRVRDRETVRALLHRAGISTNIHYPVPVHLQPAHADLGYKAGDFPVAEAFARETLSLPLYPELPAGDVGKIVRTMNALAAGERAKPQEEESEHV
jgi:dTDP-4-amino-4,6-dideoxygalactose transaminase